MTSQHIEVHENNVLMSIQTGFDISLTSQSAVSQTSDACTDAESYFLRIENQELEDGVHDETTGVFSKRTH